MSRNMDVDDDNDELIAVLPLHYSDALNPNIQLHQFPLLTRPLQAPPSATASGKCITARIKPETRRLEIHIPVDTRIEVCNPERSKQLGAAQLEDDCEKNQEKREQIGEDVEPRLAEVRLRSEQVTHKGTQVLGIVRDGKIYLHPINEAHQFRPTLTYLDFLSRKTKRSRGAGSDSESDDGPPPDPDEATPTVSKKDKKSYGEAREVQVSARKAEDQNSLGGQGVSNIRREMLHAIRAEEDEQWEKYSFCDATTQQSSEIFETLFSQNEEVLDCTTNIATFIKSIDGL